MEKAINKRVEDYLISFKNGIKDKIISLGFQEKDKISEVLEFVFEFERLVFERDDIVKKKRVKPEIPLEQRCVAKRANGEQCTRRKKRECEFCGTHDRGTPHGAMANATELSNTVQKMEVFAEEVDGIVYYIDKYKNIYCTEDILSNKENPRIVGNIHENKIQFIEV
jgi:hypothetical protein